MDLISFVSLIWFCISTCSAKNSFTLHQVPVEPASVWNGPASMKYTYQKYGRKVPQEVELAAEVMALQAVSGSVPAISADIDAQYVIGVSVGKYNMTLNLDTGSADL
jgi:hypothetical protein